MLNLYKMLTIRRRPARPPRPTDSTLRFTPRDWADLPPHHPRSERD